MIKKIVLLLLVTLLAVGSVSPLSAKVEKNFFKQIKFSETSDALAFKFDFANNGKISHEIKFFERFIQLELTRTFIKEKKSLKVSSDILDNAQIYAYKPGVIRVRLFLKVDGNMFSDKYRIRSEGKRLVLYIKKEAHNIGKGLENKIVKELDREILTALSGGSNEKVSVSEKNSNQPSVKGSERESTPILKPAPAPGLESKPVKTAPLVSGEALRSPPIPNAEKIAELKPTTPVTADIHPLEEKPKKKSPPSDKGVENRTATESETSSGLDYELGTLFPDFFKMAGALGIVLGLIFLATAGAKKILSQNSSLLGGGRLVRVISSTPIGVKKQITLVDVAGEVLVLGVSSENISMLMKLAPEDAVTILSSVKDGEKSRPFPRGGRVLKKRKKEKDNFNVEVEKAVETQKLSQRDELINDVAKSIREKIEVLKKA